MKRLIWILMLLPTVLGACYKRELPDVKPADVKLNIQYEDEYSFLSTAGAKVTVYNTVTGRSYTQIADSTGKLSFSEIPSGYYDFSATIAYAPAVFTALTGIAAEDTVNFSFSATRQTVNAGSVNDLNMPLATGRVGDLVLKQIFYAGSNTSTASGFRDQFVEIYNNSGDTINVKGLCFAQLEGNRSAGMSSTNVFQADGQYDWQRSYGMPDNIDANRNYVYCKTVYQVPPEADKFLPPGQSIVIAQNAQNHKAPYVANDGKTISPARPDLTVDLSGADYETFLGLGLASDLDNPAVPNMKVISYFGTDMILDNPGRDGFAIFFHDDVASLPAYAVPRADGQAPSASVRLNIQVPVAAIVDAVEVQHATVSSRFPKKLRAAQDAGYGFVPGGQYSSQALIRKTLRTVNGRIVVQDSNNSTNDFDIISPATPRAFK
ncbi:DUF4876 domain-containing protein [Chitinophaga horti]|uniref:DUF4876 domain-containing protein n=1 Tax=Chitinophaga horti TaxID=2920382 RepID=A0ABY6J7S3_9BACT|nr:DUF4876 domain-containing protein [Chitinophaga horti]UYQ94627.1 DUF4876 domain-containing protein [Chitinophaga horti]